MTTRRAPSVQYLRTPADLKNIVFTDGVAAVETPLSLLPSIRFKNHRRTPGPRLRKLEQAIRAHGYDPTQPIIARIGQKGRWVIVDGGHRLTAVRRIARGFWSFLFKPKIHTLYFLLYETPRSWRKMKRPDGAAKAADPIS